MLAAAVLTITASARAEGPDNFREQLNSEARYGFEEILDLWRDGDYRALYRRLVHSPGSDPEYFQYQMYYSGHRPACCWEKVQYLTTTYLDTASVSLTARLGIEAEGFGTRFVTRTFLLVKDSGVWKLPEADVISLAEPDPQRIPWIIPHRSP